MKNNQEKEAQKQFKITDPIIIVGLLLVVPLFAMFFAKYLFPNLPFVQKYLTGLPQFILISLYVGIILVGETMYMNKKRKYQNKHS